MNNYSIGFVVFGCLTKPKYRQQIEDSYNTWVQDALSMNCIVRFYVGDIPDDISSEIKELCINVGYGDAYISASWKQWRGLEHIINELSPCNWYCVLGTDTYINVKNAVNMISNYSHNECITIGGNHVSELVNNKPVHYFSGGAGIFVSFPVVQTILDQLPEFFSWWIPLTLKPLEKIHEDEDLIEYKYIINACDLQLGYLCQNEEIKWISFPEKMWGDRNYKGNDVNLKTMISCHLMKHDDFYECYKLLKNF